MNNSSHKLKEILVKYRTVAVVGLSRNPLKDSYVVAEYLKKHGFRIIPINPFVDKVLDEESYGNLLDLSVEVQKTVEIIDVFRPSVEVLPIVEQAIHLRKMFGVPHVVWMQLGIVNEQAAEIGRNAGLKIVMNKCMMREHRRFFGEFHKKEGIG